MRYSTSIRKSLLYDLGKSNKWIDLQESIKLLADYFDVHFFKNISVWENVEAKNYLRDQIWGQANFWSQAKNLFVAKFEAKIGARPPLRPGQANGAKPGQALSYSMPRVRFQPQNQIDKLLTAIII